MLNQFIDAIQLAVYTLTDAMPSQDLKTIHHRSTTILAEHSGAVLCSLPAAKVCLSDGIWSYVVMWVPQGVLSASIT